MSDKQIAKYIKDMIPLWMDFKKCDSIKELADISQRLFYKLTILMEMLIKE